MAFDKKTWANNQGGGTPLDASGLNDLESRITDIGVGIVDSGSNSNGSYIKFEDGTMICTRTETIDFAINTQQNFAIPQTFTSLFYGGVTVKGTQAGSNYNIVQSVLQQYPTVLHDVTTNEWQVWFRGNSNTSVTTRNGLFFAIGKWK